MFVQKLKECLKEEKFPQKEFQICTIDIQDHQDNSTMQENQSILKGLNLDNLIDNQFDPNQLDNLSLKNNNEP